MIGVEEYATLERDAESIPAALTASSRSQAFASSNSDGNISSGVIPVISM